MREFGAVVQLGERFNGIEEVAGSNPAGSSEIKPLVVLPGAFVILNGC